MSQAEFVPNSGTFIPKIGTTTSLHFPAAFERFGKVALEQARYTRKDISKATRDTQLMKLSTILAQLFPTGVANGREGREVNGLGKGTVPQNCEVLVTAKGSSSSGNRREYYLVRCEGVMLYLRICTAMADSGYDEFAVINATAVFDEDQQELEARARSELQRLMPSAF